MGWGVGEQQQNILIIIIIIIIIIKTFGIQNRSGGWFIELFGGHMF